MLQILLSKLRSVGERNPSRVPVSVTWLDDFYVVYFETWNVVCPGQTEESRGEEVSVN